MSYLELNELSEVENLYDAFKVDEAIELLDDFIQREGITLQQKVSYQLIKGHILIHQGKLKDAFKLGRRIYKESQKTGAPLQSFDGLSLVSTVLLLFDRFDEALEVIQKAEDLLKLTSQISQNDLLQRKALISVFRGSIDFSKGNMELAEKRYEWTIGLPEETNVTLFKVWAHLQMTSILINVRNRFDLGLEYTKKALSLAKEIKFNHAWIASCHTNLGVLYSKLGEYTLSIEHNMKSLRLYEKIKNIPWVASLKSNIGGNYISTGNYDLALKYLEESLIIWEQNPIRIEFCICNLISVALEKGDTELAQKYFQRLEDLHNKRSKDTDLEIMYQYYKANMLKRSSRIRDRAKAEELLKQLLDKIPTRFNIFIDAYIDLCDLLLSEYRIDQNPEVFKELNHNIAQLLTIAENSNSYLIFCETFILQAKLALIDLDIGTARRYLTQAQKIADSYGIKRLAMKISYEHDELLKKLDIWEKLKKSKAPLSERIKLAQLDEQMESMVRKREVVIPEIVDEDPIVLLIISEGGRPLFSESFAEEWAFEDHLFGGFLTAINSFSDEMFSKGLDRANFGEYTIIMNSLHPFLVCYLFKGQSYLAQQRVAKFIENVKQDANIWKTFNDFNQASRLVQLKDIPSLEPMINKIFVDKTIPLIA
ncbi:MAG: tetratricopeptide repeat protein [Candidatus Thorarchaeota archaeon]